MKGGRAMRKVAVIGGGAAGMMAAVTAASDGARVILLEHKDRIGKKILSTGNGRCNFTNTRIRSRCATIRKNTLFPWGIIEKFDAQKAISFFLQLGCLLEKAGTDTSIPIPIRHPQCWTRSAWNWNACKWRSAQAFSIREIDPGKNGFFHPHGYRKYVRADRVILCTGSKAAPATGSDGSGL